jgi:DNA-nicking Smr family endonuclease
MIDLHGLHKDEALYHLEERIEHLRRRDYHGYLHVISGTGHHSKSGHGSRLLPHIEHYLQNHALHYIDSSKDRRGGMISIHLR